VGKLRNLDDIRCGQDALRWAESHGCEVRHGKHTVVSNEHGSCAIPLHGHEQLPCGTRKAIIKMFILLGLSIIVTIVIMGAM
jgi:hypothetical protein